MAPATARGNSHSVPAYAVEPVLQRIVIECQRGIFWRPDDGSAPSSNRVPSERERRQLQERREELAVMLTAARESPSQRQKAAAAIAQLLGGYLRGRNFTDQQKMSLVADVLADLESLPAWAIERACEKIRRGQVPEVGDNWLPTTPALFKIIARELDAVHAEQRQIEETFKLRPREVENTEERQRVGESFEALRRARGLRPIRADEEAEKRITAEQARIVAKLKLRHGEDFEIEGADNAPPADPRPEDYAEANKQLAAIYGTRNEEKVDG
jgi:hypothetical protein